MSLLAGESRRIAVISYHSSPLAEPGSGDSGGMTIYVRSLAAALARRGVETDIYTRASEPTAGEAAPAAPMSALGSGKAGRPQGGGEPTAGEAAPAAPMSALGPGKAGRPEGGGEPGTARVTRIAPGVRVIAIDAGPRTALPKERLPRYLDGFIAGIRAFAAGQRIPYEVVHSHYWQSGLAALRLTRAWGVPFVHSHHTLGKVKNSFLAPGDTPEPAERLAGEAEVIAAADVLITSTDEEWRQLGCLYGASHDLLKTIHPGVDHELFRPGDRLQARARLGLRDEAVMLYVGRIQPLKGLELALRAAAQLAPALDRRLEFLVVGGASGASGEAEVARLRRMAGELGIVDAVRFVGPQPHHRLPVYYQAADVLAVSSHYESFGLAALEAHSCGVPVVATAAGGLAHIVRDSASGFLVETRDPPEFAARLKTLLKDRKLRAAFSETAVETARVLSWDNTAEDMLELYECLVTEALPEACVC